MINYLFDIVKNVNDNTSNSDGVDKLNSRYFPMTLLILATFVITKQLVGDVIDCWAPTEFSSQWVRYTDTMCWVTNTYYLPTDVTPQEGRDTRVEYEIKYYQWVPMILAVQAILFFLPSLIWGVVADSSIDISIIVKAMRDKEVAIDPEKRDEIVKKLAIQFHRYIINKREYRSNTLATVRKRLQRTKSFCLSCGARYGNYLGIVYLFMKALCVFNAWAQLFALDTFLGPKFYAYGIDVLESMYKGVDWTNTKRFPRVTLCDFEIRKLGNITKYTVQCVMSINLFNERIFLFVWFLLLMIAVVNTFNFTCWLWQIILRRYRYEYIRKHLTLMDKLIYRENRLSLGHFVDRYLQHDGVFIILLMSKNSTSLVISEITSAIFDAYMERKRGKDEDEFISLAGSSKTTISGAAAMRKAPPKYVSSSPPTYGRHVMTRFVEDLDDSEDRPERRSYPNVDRCSRDFEETPLQIAQIRKLVREGALEPASAPPSPPQNRSNPSIYVSHPPDYP